MKFVSIGLARVRVVSIILVLAMLLTTVITAGCAKASDPTEGTHQVGAFTVSAAKADADGEFVIHIVGAEKPDTAEANLEIPVELSFTLDEGKKFEQTIIGPVVELSGIEGYGSVDISKLDLTKVEVNEPEQPLHDNGLTLSQLSNEAGDIEHAFAITDVYDPDATLRTIENYGDYTLEISDELATELIDNDALTTVDDQPTFAEGLTPEQYDEIIAKLSELIEKFGELDADFKAKLEAIVASAQEKKAAEETRLAEEQAKKEAEEKATKEAAKSGGKSSGGTTNKPPKKPSKPSTPTAPTTPTEKLKDGKYPATYGGYVRVKDNVIYIHKGTRVDGQDGETVEYATLVLGGAKGNATYAMYQTVLGFANCDVWVEMQSFARGYLITTNQYVGKGRIIGETQVIVE
jgi:hypothetical protein